MATSKVRAARLSIISNTLLIALKVAVGAAMNSVSVMSEAVHSGIDLVAAVIAYISVKESGKPADEQHHFGHGKIENLSGAIEAALIFGAGLYIIIEALQKLRTGRIAVESAGLGAAVMAFSALVNLLVSNRLLRIARETDSIALEADAMHLRTDVYTSAGVFGGLMAIHFTGFSLLDPVIAIVVAVLILKAAYELTKSAMGHILDAKLPDHEEKIIRGVLRQYSDEYVEVHKMRTRKSGAQRHIDMHLVVPKEMAVEPAHALADKVVRAIKSELTYSHVLVHIEPCNGGCTVCRKPLACTTPAFAES